MAWIIYACMTPNGDVVRRSGLFEHVDELDQELLRRGEEIVNFFELPEFLYHVRHWLSGRLTESEVAEFCNTLSMYISGGIDLQSALSDMGRSGRTSAFKQVIADLRASLLNGFPLSQSLQKTRQFPEEVLALARIGEESGTLDRVLRDAAAHIERVVAIKAAAKRALIYPGFTLAVILFGALFWLAFVVPKIAEVFKSINLQVPETTRMMMDASVWVQDYWWVVVLVIASLPLGFFLLRRNPQFRYQTDRLAWYMPVFGRIVRGTQITFYFEYLALMYGAGIVITQALETLARAVSNRFMRKRVEGIIDHLRDGQSLVHAIEETRLFDPLAVRMIGLGEETGNLEQQLRKLGEIYFSKVNALVEVLAKILEPMLVILMAGVFGFFIVAIIGPIYSSIGSMGGGQ